MLSVMNITNFVKSQTTRISFDSRLSPAQETIALTIAVEYVFCVSIFNTKGADTPYYQKGCLGRNHLMVGSNLTRTGLAGCGGLLRDEHGNWLAGFARRIGTTTSLPTLWLSYGGLRDGLSLCYNL